MRNNLVYEERIKDEREQNIKQEIDLNLSNDVEGEVIDETYELPFPVQDEIKDENVVISDSNAYKVVIYERKKSKLSSVLCSLCGKSCLTRASLKKHMRSHAPSSREKTTKDEIIKPGIYSCDLCSRKAKSKAHIKDHLERVHLKIRKFVCQVCGEKFLGMNNLQFHLTTHDNTRPRQQCTDCGVWVLDLKKHWRTSHNNTNPMICPHCGMQLQNNKKLSYHIYKHHAAAGKYRCEECQKDFKNALYLKEHVHQKHLGGFLYRCEWCDFQTNYSKNMPQHQKTKHKVEFEAARKAKLAANGPLPKSRLWQLKIESSD